jgi:hypothetical protein
MERTCTPEQREACPIRRGCRGEDVHHLAYPANQYTSAVEKRWRELPENKVKLARCLHEAIHYSGYFPVKPDREDMLGEVWGQDKSRAQAEQERQLFIGRLALDRPEDIA